MRILHIISQSPDFTGSGKFIREILRHGRRNNHDNFLVAGAQADFKLPPALIPEDHCVFVRFDGGDLDFPIPGMSDTMPYKSSVFSRLSKSQWAAYKAVFRQKIQSAIDTFRPDLLHTHHLWAVSAISRRTAPHIPMVTTCHGTCLRQHYLCPGPGKMIKEDLSGIDRVMALSNDQARKIQDTLAVPPDRIEVISGGYNKDFFFPGDKPGNGVVEFVYAGKLSVQKGVPWMLKSFEKIKDMPFRLHLAGNADEKSKQHCLSLAEKLGSRVQYHGPLSHKDLGALMRRSHVFILPSFYEGLPLVLIEALACGCRVIATALPGVLELFKTPHPEMVTLVDLPILETIDTPYRKDEKPLEEKLAKILAMSVSSVIDQPQPDMDYVGTASAGFTWDRIFSKIESVYHDVVK